MRALCERGPWVLNTRQGGWLSPCGHYWAQRETASGRGCRWSLWWMRDAKRLSSGQLLDEFFPSLHYCKMTATDGEGWWKS